MILAKFKLFRKNSVFSQAFALITSATILLSMAVSCGNNKDFTQPKTTLTIMCWNDDFRDMMEKYFIPRNEELMENVEIKWINEEIVTYADNVEKRLDNGEDIDIFVGNDDMAPRFANNANTAALSELGITEADLAGQYTYTRVLASDANKVQKGSAITAEPGIIIYRTDYAEKYLGITNQEEMQELLSSWDTFLSVAETLNEKSNGKVKMLTNSSELWMSVESAMTGLWMSNDKLDVSEDTISRWLNYINDLGKCNAFRGSKVMSDDWYSAVSDGVFCFFSAPWLNKNVSSLNADTNTIFSTAKNNGQSFGKWKTSLAPNGFVYGGSWLYSSINSQNKQLAGKIIKKFTCDPEFMRVLALGNMEYVNNRSAIAELSQIGIENPLFDGLDAFSVYSNAAESMEISLPTVYDSTISQLLYNQAIQYKNNKVTLEEASYNFRYNVWKKYKNITEKPEPIE